MNETTNEIPIYVSRDLDLMLDTNGVPFTKKNRQLMYDKMRELMPDVSPDTMNLIAVSDMIKPDEDYEYASVKHFVYGYCNNNRLFQHYDEDDPDQDYLTGDHYDPYFFANPDSPWKINKLDKVN